MNRPLTVLLIFLPYSVSIYDYTPGATYQKFARRLHYVQKIELMKIIFDQENSRSLALKKAQDWAHKQSPLTEASHEFV